MKDAKETEKDIVRALEGSDAEMRAFAANFRAGRVALRGRLISSLSGEGASGGEAEVEVTMTGRQSHVAIVKSACVRDENEAVRRVFNLGSRAHDLYALGWENRSAQAADGDYRAAPLASVHDNQESV